MKLTVQRGQTQQTDRRGRPKGVLFELSCQLVLEPHEAELVERYGQDVLVNRFGDIIIGSHIPEGSPDETQIVKLPDLTQGYRHATARLGHLIALETSIRAGCADLKAALRTRETYGGREEIEI